MIRKESFKDKKSLSTTIRNNDGTQIAAPHLRSVLAITRREFLSWAKTMTTEERYVALRLQLPQATSSYRILLENMLGDFEWQQNKPEKCIDYNLKTLEEPFQTFIDSLVFMSNEDYLDSIGFDYSYVDEPQKIYDILLAAFRHGKRKVEESPCLQKYLIKDLDYKNYISRQQWIIETIKQIENSLMTKMKNKWDSESFQDYRHKKREFLYFYKSLEQEGKQAYLGDPAEATSNEISLQILRNMKDDKKELYKKVFEWKIKNNNPNLYNYYSALFQNFKQHQMISRPKKKAHGKRKNKKRPKSIDAMSNETNETEVKQEDVLLNIKAIASEKLQKDIYGYADQISEIANSYFQRRVLAFQRLKYLLEPYGFKIKLYGSCACGIAIENSDLDVAVDDAMLENFGYIDTIQKRVQQALKYIEQILSLTTFISEIKSISSAYIPIIKFKINTMDQFYCQDPYLYSYLNRQISSGGCVQIDLTIETKPFKTKSSYGQSNIFTNSLDCKDAPQHLGIRSTEQISKWLNEYTELRPILLILKHQLTVNNLNETYNAGLNTYTLVVMLVAAYKGLKINKNEKVDSIMQKILKFWGFEFCEQVTGIYLSQNPEQQIFYEKNLENEKQKIKQSAELEVRDPLNNGKIMTKNCYRFSQIQQLFRHIYSNCILKTQQKVQQICSAWNPKKTKFNSKQLSEWVLEQLKQNQFQKLAT